MKKLSSPWWMRIFKGNIYYRLKGVAYKMKYDALKHQGTSSQRTKLRTDELLAHNSGEVAIKYTFYSSHSLIPELYKWWMKTNCPAPAVELSYLSKTEQKNLLEQMEYSVHPSLSIQKLAAQPRGQFSADIISSILNEKPVK